MNPNESLTVLPPAALSRQVDAPLWNALKSIYDSPSDEMMGLVIDYCKARKMDPIKKPVHIVPVWSSRKKMMVETIWPAISEVRTTAMRTGEYAGRDETKFGEWRTDTIGDVEMQFPEWAQVTVYRIIKGVRCAFVGPKVYWLESYANLGKYKGGERDGQTNYTPNAMWQKRQSGQLEKVCEAAALRAAFPEEVGGQPTADEAGHFTDIETVQQESPRAGAEEKIRQRTKGVAGAKDVTQPPATSTEPPAETPEQRKAREDELAAAGQRAAAAAIKAIKAKADAAEEEKRKADAAAAAKQTTELVDDEPKPIVAEIVAVEREVAQYKGQPAHAVHLKSDSFNGKAFFVGPFESIPEVGVQVEVQIETKNSAKRPGEKSHIITSLKSVE